MGSRSTISGTATHRDSKKHCPVIAQSWLKNDLLNKAKLVMYIFDNPQTTVKVIDFLIAMSLKKQYLIFPEFLKN